ncbi:MAG TPA: cyclic nucleotide-binding domain-containing protein [Thermoleophilaceae bacterium]
MDPSRLKSIALFKEIPDDALREIATFADEESVSEGKHLVDEGDYSYEFMAIEEGTAEVQRDGQHVADLGPGDFFGEIGLLEKDRRNATVVAKTPMRLITLTGWDLKRMEKSMPEAVQQIRQTMESRRA